MSYAILGATGNVGRTILKTLLQKPENHPPQIHVLVRSKSKFDKQLQTPEFKSLNHTDSATIKIFESSGISNIEILSECIKGSKAVFLCVAASNNQPGCKIARDQVEAVVSALRLIKDSNDEQGKSVKLPRLVVLSSAEAEENPFFSRDIPWPMRNILFSANSNIYNDLIAAEKLLRKESDWIDFVIVKPGGLSWDIARGHQISFDKQQTFISYADLGNGMVEVADEVDGRYEGKCVSVIVPSGAAKVAIENVPLLVKGVLVHLFPWMYGWLF